MNRLIYDPESGILAGAVPIESLREMVNRLFPEELTHAQDFRTRDNAYKIRNKMAAVLRWHEDVCRLAEETEETLP